MLFTYLCALLFIHYSTKVVSLIVASGLTTSTRFNNRNILVGLDALYKVHVGTGSDFMYSDILHTFYLYHTIVGQV